MKLIIPKNIIHKEPEIQSLLIKAERNVASHLLSSFDWVREYEESVIKYVEEVIKMVGIGLALKLNVNPDLIHKSVKVPMMTLIKASTGTLTDNELFYKSLFSKLKEKFQIASSFFKKFGFNKGKPLQPMQFKGRILYNPDTGRPLSEQEWTQITEDITDFLGDKIGNLEEEMVVRAGLFGKLIQKMEAEGIKQNDQKKITYDEVEEKYGYVPNNIEDAKEDFNLTSQEEQAYRYSMAHAGEHLAIEDGSLKNKIVNMVKKQITGGLEDGISAQELTQRLYWMDPSDELGKRFSKDTIDAINRDWRRVAITELSDAFNNGYLLANEADAKKGEDLYFVFSGNIIPTSAEECEDALGKIVKLVSEPLNDEKIKDRYTDTAIWVGKNNVGRKPWWVAIPMHPNCLCHKSAPVYTSKGYMKIGDIKIGDYVLTHKGRFKKVTYTFRGEYNEYYEVWFKYGKSKRKLVVTEEHPFLTQRGWVKACKLKTNDKLKSLIFKCKNKILKNHTKEYNFDFTNIISIEKKIRKSNMHKETYNLEIEDDNSFIVDGIVVHNCRHYWERINPQIEEWDESINKIVFKEEE